MFNIGDRVRVVKPKYSSYGYRPEIDGYEGVIKIYNFRYSEKIGVDFGLEHILFHTLMCHLPKLTGRWFYEDELELVLDKQVNYVEDKEYEAMLI